jgi:hypothetical protein
MSLIHSLSDHATIISADGPVRKIKKPFKFENLWLKESDFQEHAKTIGVASKNKSFLNRTNHLAGSLKVCCNKKKPLQQELNNLKDQIKQLQSKPLEKQDHREEAMLVSRYEQTMAKLTESYMQRVKKHWIKNGDRNTTLFQRAIAKRRRNTIVSIKDENDIIQFMLERISNTFVNYFRSICGSTQTNSGRPFTHTQMLGDEQDYTYSIPDEK